MRIKKKKVILKINGKSARFNLSKHQISFLKDKFNVDNIEELDDNIIELLKSKLMILTDTRQKKKKKYKIWDIVTCVILASFSSVESWYEINDFIVLYNRKVIPKFIKHFRTKITTKIRDSNISVL